MAFRRRVVEKLRIYHNKNKKTCEANLKSSIVITLTDVAIVIRNTLWLSHEKEGVTVLSRKLPIVKIFVSSTHTHTPIDDCVSLLAFSVRSAKCLLNKVASQSAIIANGFRTSSETSFKFLEKGVDYAYNGRSFWSVYDFERHFGRLPLL